MRMIQSGLFKKKVKKLNRREKEQLDEAIRVLVKNPLTGEPKKGDLKTVYVHKFYIDKTLYLLAYRFSRETIELLMLGPHENYYTDLKNYLRKS